MADDWDDIVPARPQPSAGASWNDNKGGTKPPGGRGRGASSLIKQMSDVRVSNSDDWDAPGAKPVTVPNGQAKTIPYSPGWTPQTEKPSTEWGEVSNNNNSWTAKPAASSDDWNAPPSSSQFQDADDQPRGGGWGSSATTTESGGWKGASNGGGNRACFKCGEDGHMSRECPKGGGGGGGSRACHKCGEEGHMSRDCPNGGGGGGGGRGRGCFKCGEEGHMSRDCPTGGSGGGGGGGGNRGCFKCGEEGHMSRDCPTGGSGGGGGGGGRGCFKCGEEGHMSRDCPTGGSGGGGGGGGNRGCFKCGEEGHMSRDCPTGGSGGGRPGGGGGDGACFKCHETGHMSKDCPNPFSNLTADGKPREQYIPVEITDEKELFSGIKTGLNFANFDTVALQVTGKDVPQYITSFEEAGLRPLLLQNIKNSGYVKPTPVQKGAIACILAKRDVIASAVTGSGKTAAYLVPVLNILLEQGVDGASHAPVQKPEVVIIAPTRELAIQIHNEARKFSHNSVMKTVIIYGGTVVHNQRNNLTAGCNILVATPGRLKDFVDRNLLDFSNVKFFILDEADRMLDMGFIGEIEKIANHPTMTPKGVRQTLMFSATFPSDVQLLALKYLNDYIFIATGTVGGTNPDVNQEFYEVARSEKRSKLMEILQRIGDAKTIVFVDSKKTADFVAAFLCNNEFKATSIHGDRLQSQRETALREFKHGIRNILVATNVAARGLDIAGVEFVINYELPNDIEEYVHRIGRTGRVGNTGHSISFFDHERDGPNAGKLVEKLVASGSDIPLFLQSAVSGIGGMGYNFNAPTMQSGFNSRDMRRFGDKMGGAPQPSEVEESWD